MTSDGTAGARPPSRLSPDRLVVRYRVRGVDVRQVAEAIRVEQTIEFPYELAPAWIRETIVGRIESIDGDPDDGSVTLSYHPDVVGQEPAQLLNVVWGNVSLFENVRLVDLSLPDSLLRLFPGPRLGVPGLRALLRAPDRPLLATALKPMGTAAADLARMAGILAANGIDLVKDDQGLTDQRWAPWDERVARCAEAVRASSERAGRPSLYLPALNFPGPQLLDRAHRARDLGAGGLLVVPGLVGYDAIRALAGDPDLGLPIMAHPAGAGSGVVNPAQGWRHGLLLGLFARVQGADVCIFPHAGGRFAFSQQVCDDIAAECRRPLPGIAAAWPAPGGGIALERIDDTLAVYGRDVVLLVGGALHRGDLATNAGQLRARVEEWTDPAHSE